MTAALMRAQAQLERAKTMSAYHQARAITPEEVERQSSVKGYKPSCAALCVL